MWLYCLQRVPHFFLRQKAYFVRLAIDPQIARRSIRDGKDLALAVEITASDEQCGQLVDGYVMLVEVSKLEARVARLEKGIQQ